MFYSVVKPEQTLLTWNLSKCLDLITLPIKPNIFEIYVLKLRYYSNSQFWVFLH